MDSAMYTPPFNRVDDEAEIRRMVADCRTAWLITSSPDGLPLATFLPIIWRDSSVVAHMAKANPHWRHIDSGSAALLVLTGPEAYVSPSWYAAKAEHGKVVPTWNYSAVQLRGTAEVHHDPEWLREAVTGLTEVHERDRELPWRVTDAPAPFIAGQLGGIVGIEIAVTEVAGKAKLSQNRSEADQRGIVEGLRTEADADGQAVAEAMAEALDRGRQTSRPR